MAKKNGCNPIHRVAIVLDGDFEEFLGFESKEERQAFCTGVLYGSQTEFVEGHMFFWPEDAELFKEMHPDAFDDALIERNK